MRIALLAILAAFLLTSSAIGQTLGGKVGTTNFDSPYINNGPAMKEALVCAGEILPNLKDEIANGTIVVASFEYLGPVANGAHQANVDGTGTIAVDEFITNTMEATLIIIHEYGHIENARAAGPGFGKDPTTQENPPPSGAPNPDAWCNHASLYCGAMDEICDFAQTQGSDKWPQCDFIADTCNTLIMMQIQCGLQGGLGASACSVCDPASPLPCPCV